MPGLPKSASNDVAGQVGADTQGGDRANYGTKPIGGGMAPLTEVMDGLSVEQLWSV